jgi:PKD repeat protein
VGAIPTAAFTVSPGDPVPGQLVSFNGSASTAPEGRRIVNYSWDFGDGRTFNGGSSPRAENRYALEGTYNVTLVVTDETGKKGVGSQTVAVALPDAESLTAPKVK